MKSEICWKPEIQGFTDHVEGFYTKKDRKLLDGFEQNSDLINMSSKRMLLFFNTSKREQAFIQGEMLGNSPIQQ